ncbi:hypothetical protein M433DRAFT_525265 [Acidomyces richmondensis BFW]|nr:MAG: hypothetical protein FE78DRAFT_339627 [Acidomyces sp. 'richmondensis']KYG40845.1 hypothetical protein M433DRAFT_525265 [Acidomyces richmondensis BFW]
MLVVGYEHVPTGTIPPRTPASSTRWRSTASPCATNVAHTSPARSHLGAQSMHPGWWPGWHGRTIRGRSRAPNTLIHLSADRPGLSSKALVCASRHYSMLSVKIPEDLAARPDSRPAHVNITLVATHLHRCAFARCCMRVVLLLPPSPNCYTRTT